MMTQGGSKPDDGDDIVFVEAALPVERDQALRTVVGMVGRCRLDNRRDAKGNRQVFNCSILRMTQNAIEVAAPVTCKVGEWADLHFDMLGRFDGQVIRSSPRSFLMRIVATDEHRGRIASKIAWLTDKNAVEVRRHPRFVPFAPHSTLMLPDDSTRPCEVIDYSASGAALSADVEPPVGQHLQVGKIVGRVVRRFAGGFAIEFSDVQSSGSIRELFMRRLDRD